MTTLSDKMIGALALKHFGDLGDARVIRMTAYVWPESSGNPSAVGPRDRHGAYPVGLWQVKSEPVHNVSVEALKDPDTNANAARRVLDAEGDKAWAVSNSGAYLLYMPRARKAVADAKAGGGPSLWDKARIALGLPGSPVAGAVQVGEDVAGAFKSMDDVWKVIGGAVVWLTSAHNWLRISYVAGGLGVMVVGLGVLAKPAAETVVSVAAPAAGAVGKAAATRTGYGSRAFFGSD